MGIIRPQQHNDGAGRWALTLDEAGEHHLIGTRTAILDASARLNEANVSYAVYRRPGLTAPWQLVQDRHGRAPVGP